MTSYLGGGLASLDRWEGLKEWHRRHQSILGETLGRETTGQTNQIQDFSSDNSSFALKDAFKPDDVSMEVDLLAPPAVKHDLSIIPEADEDSRSRDGDRDIRSKQEKQLDLIVNKKGGSGSGTNKFTEGNKKHTENLSQDSNKVVKRPFLRRGQGLLKYRLQPDDLKKPYQTGSSKPNTVQNRKSNPKPSNFSMRQVSSNAARPTKPVNEGQYNSTKTSKSDDLSAPVQRLVLSIPSQKASSVDIGTWSQVFEAEEKPSSVSAPENVPRYYKDPQLNKEDRFRSILTRTEPQKSRGNMSPVKKVTISKPDSSPEEDQESLAAYLDLEQHVGNASFCSTSSKVDRLIAKSSKIALHQSNPDAITQSKQLSPIKTGRKFVCSAKDNNSLSEDHHTMWSVSDLENLIKSRARRSGSLLKPQSQELDSDISEKAQLNSVENLPFMRSDDKELCESSQAQPVSQNVDWMLEILGPARKPHLMKTMSSIDLDSSLIKNALSKESVENVESDSDSSLSDSSSEEESEEEISTRMKTSNISEQSIQVMESPVAVKETSPQKPFKLMNDANLEEINHQIESHLSDLKKEIETLQSAKNKSQKYTTSLEKKVQELENRLMIDTRSFNKRLEDEREAAAKRLSEELGKFSKEKQALQRTLREERRKAPDPITHQEVLRLKQEIADWEERWRTDRAKARGLESNLRIQITNLKRENDKLKEDNSKLKREKETAVNTAKAKASSNTRVINSIAQQLGSVKPKVTVVREENSKFGKQPKGSAYNLKSGKDTSNHKAQTTIESFPNVPHKSNEWSTDEEVDLGKETSDDDVGGDSDCELDAAGKSLQSRISLLRNGKADSLKASSLECEPFDLDEAQAKYDAIFGKSGIDAEIITGNKGSPPSLPPTLEPLHSSGNHISSSSTYETEKFMRSIHHPDGKLEQVKENGTKIITHPDGTWTRHSSSGSVMTVPPSGWPVHISYFNGDQLEKLSDGTTHYFYAKTNVWQTTYPDGHEELRYPSGQVEQREKSGSVKVLLPDADRRRNGKEHESDLTSSANGIAVEQLPNGDSIILLPNGEKELHTRDYMRKDFLDGTVKFMYKDGSQETKYPSGRIRIKDAHGNLVKDTGLTF